jgi:hypothetical protein
MEEFFMEDILRPIYQERASSKNTLGILSIEKREGWNYQEETFDNILLVIAKEVEKNLLVKHYAYQDKKAALYIVDEEQLKEWLLLGTNRKILNWLSDGKIVFDRNDYVHRLKNELRESSANERNLKMAIEFSKIIKSYTDGKAFFHNGHYMDAYHHISRSLYHLACLAIIEKGFQPEQTMWDQVKQLNPEIYKLYEELLTSNENIEKRLELLFLASEFLIHSHTESGVSHFLNVLRKKDYWSIDDLINHPEVKYYAIDLETLLEYLIHQNYVRIVQAETKGIHIYHRFYKIS